MPLRDFVTGSQKNRIKAVGGATALILAAAAGLYSLKVEDPDGNNAISFSAYGVPCVGNPADCGESGEVLINQGGSGTALAWGTAGIDLTTTDARYVEIQGSTMTGALAIKVTSGTATGNTLVVDTKGLVYDATNKRVGIGTTEPDAKFHIQSGTAGFRFSKQSVNRAEIRFSDASDSSIYAHYDAYGHNFEYGANQLMTIMASGNVGIGTTNPGGKLSIGGDNSKILLGAAEDASIYYDGTNMVFDSQNVGTGDFVFDNGNVGIGTATPTTALEVIGTISGSVLNTTGNIGILTDNAQLQMGAAGATDYYQTFDGTDAQFYTPNYFQFTTGKVEITSDTLGNGAQLSNLIIRDSTAPTSGFGGGISLGGKYTAAAYVNEFAGIQGLKENSTSGDYAGAFRITTRINGGAPTERLRIDSVGNVGIGTTSPGAKLSIKIPDTTTVPLIIESNDGTDILKLQQYANTARAQLQIGTYNGISTPNYSFVGDTNTGMAGGYLADTLQFVTNNTEKVRITSTGNVGIGTTSPTTALEVVGTMSGTTIFSGSGMILGDNDGVGCTQISCNDGNCTFSSLTCP